MRYMDELVLRSMRKVVRILSRVVEDIIKNLNKSGTSILRCTCEHPFQDRVYGTGMRVHNNMGAQGGGARCTVCSDVKK